jgi:hypothetical protein
MEGAGQRRRGMAIVARHLPLIQSLAKLVYDQHKMMTMVFEVSITLVAIEA